MGEKGRIRVGREPRPSPFSGVGTHGDLQPHPFTPPLLGLCSEGCVLAEPLCGQSRQKAPPGIPSLLIQRQMFYDSSVLRRQSCFKYSYYNLHPQFVQIFFCFCFEIPETAICPQTGPWNSASLRAQVEWFCVFLFLLKQIRCLVSGITHGCH